MHFPTTLVASLLPLLALSAPAPEAEGGSASAPACIVPLVLFTSLPNPFTIDALTPCTQTETVPSWPVVVQGGEAQDTISKPIISRIPRFAPTLFTLKDGKLRYGDFDAGTLPVPLIFPPPLTSFVWGGRGPRGPLNFTAGFACDAAGHQYLQLRNSEGLPFVVASVEEGKQVFLKPAQFQGKSVQVNLRTSGGQ